MFFVNTSCKFICVPLQVHRFACHESFGGGEEGLVTAGIGTVSVAPFDTVLLPEKQETEMVVWCFSPEGQPPICSL